MDGMKKNQELLTNLVKELVKGQKDMMNLLTMSLFRNPYQGKRKRSVDYDIEEIDEESDSLSG